MAQREGEMKDKLRSMERELLDMRVSRSPENIKSAAASTESTRKVTKQGFINAQQLHIHKTPCASGEEFINELISRPHRRRPRKGGEHHEQRVTPTSSSEGSEPLPRRTPMDQQIDSALQLRIYDERRRLENEYKRTVQTLQQDMEQLRHKRLCDKEVYTDELQKYERDLNELKAINKNMEDNNLKIHHESELLVSTNNNLKSELEKLNREIERLEGRNTRCAQSMTEYESKLTAEKRVFDAKLHQYEQQLAELSDKNVRLEAKVEAGNVRIGELNAEINTYKATVAEVATVNESLLHDAERLKRRHDGELDDLHRSHQKVLLELTEASHEAQAEKDRVVKLSNELRALEQERESMVVYVEALEHDRKELKNLRNIHEQASQDRLMLQTQVRAMGDECERLRAAANMATQKYRGAQSRVDDLEVEGQGLKKKIEALQIQCSRTIATSANRSRDFIEGLTDLEGAPLCKLKNAGLRRPQSASRPVWWFDGQNESTADCVVPTPQTCDVVMPVSVPTSGLSVIKAERRQLMRELAKMPPNPAYRTTDENERWEHLKDQLVKCEDDIRLLETA